MIWTTIFNCFFTSRETSGPVIGPMQFVAVQMTVPGFVAAQIIV